MRICVESRHISLFLHSVHALVPVGRTWKGSGEGDVRNQPSGPSHWSASIDMALQSCQSRETFGIPVGPDTSRVVAEILLAGGENESRLAQVLAGRPMVRVVDDYLIGFDTEQAARTALARLREALWSFNLQLNDQKTGIFRSSTVHREKWQLDFDYINLAARNIEQQRRDIDHLKWLFTTVMQRTANVQRFGLVEGSQSF